MNEIPKTPPKTHQGAESSTFKYEKIYTKTNWGKETRIIFSGDEKNQQVIIKTRDIVQRFLAWIGIASEKFFTNTKLLINEQSRATTPDELVNTVKQQVKKANVHPAIVKFIQKDLETQIRKTAEKVENAHIFGLHAHPEYEKDIDTYDFVVGRQKLEKDIAKLNAEVSKNAEAVNVDAFDQAGRTSLYRAVVDLDVALVTSLREKNANPNLAMKDPTVGRLNTPMLVIDEKIKQLTTHLMQRHGVPVRLIDMWQAQLDKAEKIKNLLLEPPGQ